MEQKLGGVEAPIPTIDGANKAEQATYNQIMKKWRLNRLKRKGLVAGDAEKAKANFLKANISDDYHQPLGIYSARLSALNKHGESLRIYFSFLEQLIWLTLVLAVLGGANMMVNYDGGYYNGTNKNSKSDASREAQELLGKANLFTIANFKGYANFTMDS